MPRGKLTGQGFPQHAIAPEQIAATLESVQSDMLEKYRAKRKAILEKLGQMQALLNDSNAWWNHTDALASARANFHAFADNIAHNFGPDSFCHARIESAAARAAWRIRQLNAIVHYHTDRRAWNDALDALMQP